MSLESPAIKTTAARDEEYSRRFWEKGQPDGMREAMLNNLMSAAERGIFSLFVSIEGFSEKDKEKMSAYRILASEIGYEIGPFRLNRETGTASAEIRKIAK